MAKSRRTKSKGKTSNKKYGFFLTNAFGKGKEHYGLQISEDDKTWSFMVLTHNPTGHYRLKRDPVTGKRNPEIAFLNTSIRTKPKSTRVREDKVRTLSDEDVKYIDNLLQKKKKPLKG